MKTICVIIVSLSVLMFNSCSKESLFEIEANPSLGIQSEEVSTDLTFAPSEVPNIASIGGETTIQLQVSANVETSGEYAVDFSGEADYSQMVLKGSQSLDFLDALSNTVTLSFQVNTSTGGLETLETNFAIAGHTLKGLQLKQTQQIVIEDVIIN